MSLFRNDRKRDLRRGFGISAYVGANGGGKTACMLWDAKPSLDAGRPVLSTVRVLDYDNPRECDDEMCAENPDRLDHFQLRPTPEGREAALRNQKRLFLYGPNAELEEVEMVSLGVHRAAHPLWIPWTNWEQLLTMKFGEVLADEMTGIAESRASQSLPVEVINALQQLRRADIPFRYTSPSWERADVSLRQPTQTVTVCRGSWSVEAPAEGDETRVWKSRRLFRWVTYDAMQLTELTEGKRGELRPEVRDWHWGPGSPAWAMYDTFAPVLLVGHSTASGKCHRCGGSRPAPKCSCGDSPGSAVVPVPAVADARRRAKPPSTGAASDTGAPVGRRALRAVEGQT